jgi:regulator of protease activity HflC (stomatin/prohibitin superfamily)
MTTEDYGVVKTISRVVVGIVLLIVGLLGGCPLYNVWQKGLSGEAELRQAEWNRQIKIREAQAAEESAKHLATAEVERAKGVAQANQIIGTSLKDNEAYLRWLWIEGTKENQGKTVVYIPTEANLPILEAGRTSTLHPKLEK